MGYCVLSLRKGVVKMDREILRRFITAGEYQKKAIYSLFPDHVCRHLDVIEKEVKGMAVEIVQEIARECSKCGNKEQGQKSEQEVKKVDIV